MTSHSEAQSTDQEMMARVLKGQEHLTVEQQLRNVCESFEVVQKDNRRLYALADKQEDEIALLRDALVKSVAVAQAWHNQGIPVRECSKLWDIYWRNAPEMKPIREALTALRESQS